MITKIQASHILAKAKETVKPPPVEEKPDTVKVADPAKAVIVEPVLKFTTQDLFDWVAKNKNWKGTTAERTIRTWLVNAEKIIKERIDSEPLAIKNELILKYGWT